MTREEALKTWLPIIKQGVSNMSLCAEALDMAIKALEQDPCENVPDINDGNIYECSCGYGWDQSKVVRHHFCPNCGRAVDNLIKTELNRVKTELEPCEDAISRQAVLETIDIRAWEFCDYLIRNGRNDEQKPVSHFADNLRECVGEGLPPVTPMQKWIPVSEKLPPNEEKSYWICTENGYQCQCRWTNVNHIFTYLTSDWHWHIMDIPQYDKVVAWMPLPEPYQPEIPTGEESEG